MIRHVVLWKLDTSYTKTEKETIRSEFKHRLESLIDKIDVILSLHVHFNHPDAPEQNYDILLDTTFNSLEDLNTYQVHPDHMEVVKYVKTLKLQRTAIDHSLNQ